MSKNVKQTLALIADALGRLLVLLSVAFLVYEVRLRTSEATYHPLYVYWQYVVDLVTLRPGVTPQGIPASFYIVPALGRTIALFVASMAAGLVAGLLLARWNFVHFRERAVKRLERLGSMAYALPIAVLAMLLFAIATETGWFPLGGTSSPGYASLGPLAQLLDLLHHFLLPWGALALFPALVLIRSGLRAVEELRYAEYVVTAKAHGFTDRELYRYHARRPVLARLFADLAAHLPLFVTYLVIVELVFRYTGAGYYLVQPYTGFWGTRGRDVFVVSQAALIYVGALTVFSQLALRLAGLWLVPTLRRQSDGEGARLALVVGAVISIVVVGALATPVVAAGDAWAGSAIIGVVMAGCGIVAVLAMPMIRARRNREGRSPRPGTTEPSGTRVPTDAPDDRSDVGDVELAGGRLRSWLRQRVRPGHAIAVALLIVLIVLPWVVPMPRRPSPIILVRPNAIEHPYLIWYYFVGTLLSGKFLLVVLLAAIAGAIAGTALGTLAGYYRATALNRGIAYLEVFPSILVAILVAGLTTIRGVPLLAALVVAATIRFCGQSRDFGVALRKSDFVRYGVAIGEGPIEQFRRHVLPNLARRFIPDLIGIYVDLIVLTVNLSFLRLVPVRRFGPPVEAPIGPIRHAVVLMHDWGSQLAAARSDFIRGIYLPSVWPLVLLIGTIVLLRYLVPTRRSV
jgi:ABC-type dipeptide/oligopeptide/nickel transport system permease component